MDLSTNFSTSFGSGSGSGMPSNSRFSINWLLNEKVTGPVMATFVGVEFVLSLVANTFICVHTLKNAKSFKKSSTVLLFNLALVNLLMTVLYMPFVVIATAAEEWIFGQTDQQRDILCQISAFVFGYTVTISFHTLAGISFDRFLFIVKPRWHKRIMKYKVALGFVIFLWLLSVLLNITPFLGLGEYRWATATGSCLPVWVGNNTAYVIYLSIGSIPPFGTIVVTTTWTYVFTKRFLRRDLKRNRSTLKQESLEQGKSVYTERIRNLMGIFGTLLLFNVITLSPYIIAIVVGLIIGFENLPPQVFATAFVAFLLSNITNPVIQSYFRRELRDSIIKYYRKLTCCCQTETSTPKVHRNETFSTNAMSIDTSLHGHMHVSADFVTDMTTVHGSPARSTASASHESLNPAFQASPARAVADSTHEPLKPASHAQPVYSSARGVASTTPEPLNLASQIKPSMESQEVEIGTGTATEAVSEQ